MQWYSCWSWMKSVYHAMIRYWSWGWYVDRTDDRGVDHAWCITKLCHYESYRDHYLGNPGSRFFFLTTPASSSNTKPKHLLPSCPSPPLPPQGCAEPACWVGVLACCSPVAATEPANGLGWKHNTKNNVDSYFKWHIHQRNIKQTDILESPI